MERDQEWIIAMATALGTNSGLSVPIVPDVRLFRDLFDAVAAREREACEQAVRDEPELPGEIPQAMFDAVRHDKDACSEALRILVRVTKAEILGRIAKRSSVGIEPPRSGRLK